MKKIIIIFMFAFLSISLIACQDEKTYDDLYAEYLSHVENNQAVYQSTIDYFNHISNENIKSVVLVEKTISSTNTSTVGSGIIIKTSTLYYYVLTNNHVIYTLPGSFGVSYEVSDYLGNEYHAVLIANNEDYDLAILRFERGVTSLPIVEFSATNPRVGEKLAVLGYPSYQINAITLGNVIDYSQIDVENTSIDIINVLFDVLISDVPVKSGSSGSMVINDHYELVGVIYAGNFAESNDMSEYSFSIPIEKIFEFFQLENFDLEIET